MANIYIIAGPPGVGKSTSGELYIDPDLDILNEDEMRFKYKGKGYVDYNEYSMHRVRDIIRHKLIKDQDFALELNLGFERQYDYALTLKRFSTENKLNVILFFTDDVALCQDRARKRHESGLHLVTPDIIQQMFDNTMPLLKKNFDAIDKIQFIHSGQTNQVKVVAQYDRASKKFSILDHHIKWFNSELKDFIQSRLDLKPNLKQKIQRKKPGGPKL